MSVYIIFPDLGNTKLHIFVGLSLPTPCALYSVLSCSVHMVYTEMWGTLLCLTTTCCIKNIFYSERVSSDRLLVDIGSLDVSLDDLLAAQSQKQRKTIDNMVGDACTISKEKHNQDVHMLENLPQTVLLHRSVNSDAGCTLIWCFTIKRKTKKKKKISPRLNLAPEPQQSQA